jgi:peptidoglycan/xylan/chitin deacetylase (PgdA/CDA1 family)
LLLGWLAFRQLVRPGGHPVLVYHSVSEDQRWLPWANDIAVRPEDLDRHLRFLGRCGFHILGTDEWIERRSRGALGPRDLAIHFDDGYLDNWVAAAPILSRHRTPATIFVSLDFMSTQTGLRPTLAMRDTGQVAPSAIQWGGYMNWEEARALDATDLIDIQPHGVDHARVPISARTVTTLTASNWRALAWRQWRSMPGNKADWWRHDEPPALGYGTPVPESAPALSANAWLGDRPERDDEFLQRARSDLRRCIDAFQERLGKTPRVFCWPENRANDLARKVAAELGYVATTGGTNENRVNSSQDVISRLHVGDRRLGFRNVPADLLYLYGSIRCFQGYYYWYYALLPMHSIRAVVKLGRRYLGR